jgi:hypothetical protein
MEKCTRDFSTYMNYWGDADPADVRVSLLKTVFSEEPDQQVHGLFMCAGT